MKELLFPEVPEGKTEAARLARKEFLERYEAEIVRPAKEIALNVLVWGPAPESKSPVARKRRDIRDAIENRGHNAFFSEDIPRLTAEDTERSREFAQAKAADQIIVLVEGSPGALAETHDFCNHPEIAPKVLVLIPEAYRQGYSAKGAIQDLEDAHGGVYWYGPDEVEQCSLLARAVRRVEARRHILAQYRGRS